MSNLLGMYGQNNGKNIPGVDYPNITGWPRGYVPIAPHTVDHDSDHLLIPHAPCKRMNWLFEMLRTQSEEVRGFINKPEVRIFFF
ncbi:unnamed protein product [Strongylus vulgaris]|uniref:Uncharacterized protein n=1 Tax=Strongylus vulgaris TaxID=40348 RepID=A0A3P7KNI4_STRVU|nr:unnamed protein product [Strongylus vulgaris]